jgi:release factor glutamine methyltransferase
VTYDQLLKLAYKKVYQHDAEEEAAKLLLLELSGMTPHAFYLSLKSPVEPAFETLYLEKLDEYLIEGKPVQHILGYSYFFGYKLYVDDRVLIPRPETEQLTDHVLYYYDRYFQKVQVRVLDLGTGSGCIGLTLAKEEPMMDVTISDISFDALEVATKNQELLKTQATVIQSDLFENIKGTFDIIVSNPPYIPDDEAVGRTVDKEPDVALYGGKLGIEFYEKILNEASKYLNSKGLIAFEHGYQQKEAIYQSAKNNFPEAIILQMKDLAGKDRFTLIGLGGVLSEEK